MIGATVRRSTYTTSGVTRMSSNRCFRSHRLLRLLRGEATAVIALASLAIDAQTGFGIEEVEAAGVEDELDPFSFSDRALGIELRNEGRLRLLRRSMEPRGNLHSDVVGELLRLFRQHRRRVDREMDHDLRP